jgi:Flp pilus assembly pilin Flp
MIIAEPEQPINQEVPEHKLLTDFLRTESGLTITEYAVAAGLIAAAIAASFAVLGPTVDAIMVTVIAFL